MPSSLQRDLQRSGYYPELVGRVLSLAIAGEDVRAHLVHPETTFDSTRLMRHLTAAVITGTRLIAVHVDELPEGSGRAVATTEAVRLDAIRSVVLSHGVRQPENPHQSTVEELTISALWGSAQRVEMEPAVCPDPQCEADHGYTGLMSADDLVLRVSAHADGSSSLDQALQFAQVLSQATAGGL